MPKSPKKTQSFLQLLGDKSMPLEQRSMLLRTLCGDPDPDAVAALHALLEGHAGANGESLYTEKLKEMEEMLQQLRSGPMRGAIFLDLIKVGSVQTPQAFVVLDDGAYAYTCVPDDKLAKELRRGDRVILEGKGRALLAKAPDYLRVGEEAQFERRIDDKHVEVSGRGQERHVFVMSQGLAEQLDAGKVEPGATLVVSSRQFFADHALPAQDGLAHYRYLEKVPPPDVRAGRDIGAPPRFIEEVAEMVRQEMTAPDARRRYRLRRCLMKLLHGVTGSGKTLAIHALWRRIYEVVSEVTGVAVSELPCRVFRLRPSQVLSMWFGQSDANIDRFFDEIEQLAKEKLVVNGQQFTLPILAIIEEVDGIGHTRGHDNIYDRVITTLLQRLDTTREELRDKLIIFIGTTNDLGSVDRAFLRRLGSTVHRIGHLNKSSFVLVLEKHLNGLPLASNNGCAALEGRVTRVPHTPDASSREVRDTKSGTRSEGLEVGDSCNSSLQRRIMNGLTAWLYSPNGPDKGLIELAYAGSTTPQIRYRRDFLTGSIVDRAVQQACAEAAQLEAQGVERPGISLELLMRAFDGQFRGVAEQVNEHNARHYLELPDAVRVATVRRIAQPAILPIELERQPMMMRDA